MHLWENFYVVNVCSPPFLVYFLKFVMLDIDSVPAMNVMRHIHKIMAYLNEIILK